MRKIICIIYSIIFFIFPCINSCKISKETIYSLNDLYIAMAEDCIEHKASAQYFISFKCPDLECCVVENILEKRQNTMGLCLKSIDWHGYQTLSGYVFNIEYSYHTTAKEMEISKKIAQEIANDIQGLSTYEKVKVVHDYLAISCKYDGNGTSPYSALLKKKTNCAGYALAFKMIMDASNVQSAYQTSDTHAWNTVRIDNEWYNIDVCWDDAGAHEGDAPLIMYDYFLKGQEDWQNHPDNKATATKGYEGDLMFGAEIVEKLLKKDFTNN